MVKELATGEPRWRAHCDSRIIDSGTGETIHPPLESDNYRGLFMSDDSWYVQTDFKISSRGPGSSVVFNAHMNLPVLAFGCVIA
jgi:hypothetical protein